MMEISIQAMIADLEVAKALSSDYPDAPPVNPTSHVYTGQRGHPRIEIDPTILATSIQLWGPTELSQVFGTSARTVHRHALEQGLVQPGDPVYVNFLDNNGNTHRIYTSSTASQSGLTDDQLDDIMLQILQTFPSIGHRMIDGNLHYFGHHVPCSRVQASYARVNGPPISAFGVRRITRRVYQVPGYNSLAHHDGQHGMSPTLLDNNLVDFLCRSHLIQNCHPCFY
jgi:hypothetical protein